MRLVFLVGVAVLGVGALMDESPVEELSYSESSGQPVTTFYEASGHSSVPYDRGDWGEWEDADGDGQNTRHEVLIARSQQPVEFTNSSHSIVAKGLWYDRYSGTWQRFASDLHIDHVVPLSWAHKHGASSWSPSAKARYYNDRENLIITLAGENISKSDSGPGEWMPKNEAYTCNYIARWSYLLRKYHLSATGRDKSVISEVSARCEQEKRG